jgi:sulfite reductase (NADPH) flavoprotein alpha-component
MDDLPLTPVSSAGGSPVDSPDSSPVDMDTVCGYCGVGCGLTLTTADGTVTGARGTADHPVNRGRLCTKGGTTADLLAAGDARLTTALLRPERDADPVPVDVADAVAEIAATFTRLRGTHGDDAVALYVSGQMSTEAQYLANKLAKGYLHTNLIESNSRLCMSSAATGYKQSLGADGPPGSYDDLDHADVFLVIGSNMADCHPILFLRMMDRVKAGAKLIVVDPRRTATAARADLHLAVRPGTDMALLNGLLRLIIDAGDIDREFIDSWTDGWDDMPDHLADFPADRVARITGVAEADLRTAAAWIGGADNWMSLWTMGLNQSVHGTWHTVALCNLHLATGAICRTGSGPFSLTGQPNAMGGREMGYMGPGLPGQRSVLDADDRAAVEKIWGLTPGTLHTRLGGGTVDLFSALSAGDVRAVWVICTNPVLTVPNRRRVIEALDAADYVVVQDAYRDAATVAYGDAVLPAALWSEAEGVMVNSERTMTLTRRVTDPPGQALPDWKLICLVAQEMGFPGFDFPDSAAVFDEIRRFHNPLTGWDVRGVDHRRLRRGPVQWPAAPGGEDRNPVRYRTGDGGLRFPTGSGRARFLARPYLPPAERPDREFPLVLTTGRLAHQWHTMTKTGRVRKLMKLNPSSFVQVNPVDAGPLGIAGGDLVEVTSRRGSVRAPAVVTEDVAPGVCFMPMHFPDSAVNEVTTDAVDPESLQPEFKACAVALARINGPAAAPESAGAPAGESEETTGRDADAAVTVVWASQTGTVEDHVPELVDAFGAGGVPARAVAACDVTPADLVGAAGTAGASGTVLFVVATTGDGDAPDTAVDLWRGLQDAPAGALDGVRFAVLGFGDPSYSDFCGFAVKLDERLAGLGASRITDLVRCTPDFSRTAATWRDTVLDALGGTAAGPAATVSSPGRSRTNPLPAAVAATTRLSGPGSAKDVRRIAFTLPAGTLSYEAGDALGVWPENPADLVEAWLERTGADPAAPVTVSGTDLPLAEALRTRYDLRHADPGVTDPAGLPLITPRQYSISSSPHTDPHRVEITVSVVPDGLCSTYLAAADPGTRVRIFVRRNRHFGPPEPGTPMIMVGPGTGVAPFRGFLQDREHTGATGENWLFFGDRTATSDFLYGPELAGWRDRGVLTRLDLAFSRDQAEKVYVQDRMRERAGELWSWLRRGAHLYVCGDAARMAADVDATLRGIVADQGGLDAAQADAFIADLVSSRRYVRDVY